MKELFLSLCIALAVGSGFSGANFAKDGNRVDLFVSLVSCVAACGAGFASLQMASEDKS